MTDIQLVKPEGAFSLTGEKNFFDFVRGTRCVELFLKGRTEYVMVANGVTRSVIAYYEKGQHFVDTAKLLQWNQRHSKHFVRKVA